MAHDSNADAAAGDARAHITAEIERALAGGAIVAVATVTNAGAPATSATASAASLRAGAKMLVRADGTTLGTLDGGSVDESLRAAALEQISTLPRETVRTLWVGAAHPPVDRPSQAVEGDAQVMVEIFESPARLVIVGGGHIALALAQIGDLAGFAITVLDDREDYANRERFPMAERVITGDVDEGLDTIPLDGSTYVVLVSRGHLLDEAGLRRTVGRGAAYVGMIGSRRRTHTVLSHLLAEGFEREALEAVHTPIGIDIGAETPEEIAVAIVAEMILLRRGGGGGRMAAQRPPL